MLQANYRNAQQEIIFHHPVRAGAQLFRIWFDSRYMFGSSQTSCIVALDAVPVEVEVRLRDGEQRFTILGLGGAAVRESRDRILAALQGAGFDPPNQILVNLAPAEIRKESSVFDLPIAVAIAAALGGVPQEALRELSICGELSLLGEVKPITGAAAHALAAARRGLRAVIVPRHNGSEASMVEGVKVIAVETLSHTLRVLQGREPPSIEKWSACEARPSLKSLDDVFGQIAAKRALTIAAAGGHNLLMIGPPGCGKSMLAERLTSILPSLESDHLLEVLRIHSIAGQATEGLLAGVRPFRTPHYVVSDAGLIGGGAGPRPGEVSLAHRGVLFLDEFPEFRRSAVEALRSPMETGWVQVARAKASINFPARFQLIAAMNPCPCGRLGSYVGLCRCSHSAVRDYLAKLSQPILDRIDLHVELEAVKVDDLMWSEPITPHRASNVRAVVMECQQRQLSRQGVLNSDVSDGSLRAGIAITDGARTLLGEAIKKMGISARGYTRIVRTARTIADLAYSDTVSEEAIAEAISYRSLDRLTNIVHGVPSHYSRNRVSL